MSKAAITLPAPPPKRRRVMPLVEPQGHAHAAPDTIDSSPHDELAAEPEAPEALPNDTLVALQVLKSRFPAEAKVTPFATRAQLYTVLADRTVADRELEALRRSNIVRLLRLPASRDECIVLLTSDYEAAIQQCKDVLAAAHQQSNGSGHSSASTAAAASPALLVFDWFASRVLPACTEVMITHSELLQLLAAAPQLSDGQLDQRRAAPAAASQVTDKHISLLLNQGLLTRLTGAADGYLFSIPNAGAAVRSVAAGRQEILSLLQRRRQPELLQAELLKRKLQRSVLGVRWHVADMLGSGALMRIETAVGPLLRATKRGG